MSNHKNSWGKHMPSMKSIALRRLALFAGAATLGLACGPTIAAAQTATCVSTAPPVIAGNGSSAVTLPLGTYNPGVTCNYTGTGATVSVGGAITVSSSGGVPADPLVNGVNLRATGANGVAWTSTAGTVTGGAQTNGPVIDARTATGAIVLNTGAVTGSAATITHGIYAESAGGNISITATGAVSGSNATTGRAGIEVVSTSGNGDISINTAAVSGGRLYGIRAQATGSGDLTINATGTIDTQNVTGGFVGEAVLEATTGSGLLTINTGNLGGVGSNRRVGVLRVVAGGDAEITVGALNSGINALAPIVDLTTAAGAEITFTHGAFLKSGSQEAEQMIAMRLAGGGDITMNSNGNVVGHVDFSTHAGDMQWNINGEWYSALPSTLGAGDTAVEIRDTGFLIFTTAGRTIPKGDSLTLESPTILDFGAGDDILVNRSFVMLATSRENCADCRYSFTGNYESETRFLNLETFENAGTIVFGMRARPGTAISGSQNPADFYDETDGANDDVLVMSGTTFIGGPGSRLVMDALLTANQPACDVALRGTAVTNSLDGSMPAADCISMPGGTTEGETVVSLNLLAQGDRGGPVRIVLVDVSGGTSAAGHFILDPQTPLYNPEQGGYLDLGYFIVPLVYDPDAQQHALLGIAGQNAWQQAGWAQAAHDLWRVSTGSWLERQADLRGGDTDGLGGGAWMRVSGQSSERDVVNTASGGTRAFTFDNSYEQKSYAITGGLDLMAGSSASGAWVVGLTAGYANSELTYAASPNRGQLDGWTGGAYASYLAGGLYIDAIVSANRLEMIADAPELNLSPAGTLLDTRLLSVGAQVEAGWRFPFASGAFVEPLAGVAYVQTKWDEMEVPSDDLVRAGVLVDFGDPVSLRASLGARLGLDQDYGGLRAQYAVLGRVWEEFDGEAELTLDTIVDDAFVSDEFAGTMTEVGFSASLGGGLVSGFVNLGGKWGTDYEALGGAAGVRIAW